MNRLQLNGLAGYAIGCVVRSTNKEVWVETVGNITRYIKERDDAEYQIISSSDQLIEINITDDLDNEIYNYPLSAYIKIPDEWNYVGFPGESDAEFEETLAFVAAQPLTYLHVFAYSDRPGTPASAMPGKVNPEVIAERSERLRGLGRRKDVAFQATLCRPGALRRSCSANAPPTAGWWR